MAKLPVFDSTVLEKLCQVLAGAMSGSQMTPLLASVNAPDPGEGLTKWRRMAQALGDCQRQYCVGNHVLQFINAAMEPVRFVGEVHRFEELCAELNRVLAFAGYRMGPDGKVRHAEVVTNLADAEQRAGRLRAELSRHRQGYVIQAPGSPFVPVDWRCNPSGCLWPFAHPCRGPLDSFLSRRIPSACDYEPSPWSY